MFACVMPQASSLGAEHERHPWRTERGLEIGVGIAGQADSPETGIANLLERTGEVDHTCPWHTLQGSRGGFGDNPAFRWRMTILSDDTHRAEGGRRAKDRAEIMRVRDLVQNQENGAIFRILEKSVEPHVVQRLNLDDDALVRRIAGDQARRILRSGLSSAAATACLPQKRGRLAEPWL